jgi:hypothetical protein
VATQLTTAPSQTSIAVWARIIEWLPAVTAVAYVAVVAGRFPTLIRALYWDSDAAGALVLGQLGHAHAGVEIPRFGWWSSLWYLLATRWIPGHAHVWEATGYAFAMATVVLVGWATWKVAGRWAGVTAAAVAVVVGPKTLTTLLSVNFHTSTPFTAAVLAAYLVVLTRRRSWLLAIAVGVLAGVNTASDPLLWIAGIAPFALAASALALSAKRRDVAARAAAVVGVAALVAPTTDRVMSSLGFHLIPVGVNLWSLENPVSDLVELGKSVALVFGANFLVEPTYPSGALRYAVALLGIAALASIFVAAARLRLVRAAPIAWAYACFWATAVALVGMAYWGTSLADGGGPGGGLNYMLVFAPAAGVGVALIARGSSRARLTASVLIAAVGAVNLVGLTQGHAEDLSTNAYRTELVHVLERDRLTHGYAPYWDAQSVTWRSGMRVLVAPVQPCAPGATDLCRHPFFTMDSWYRERPGRSFLIVDPGSGLVEKPPATFGPPSEVRHLVSDRDVLVYVYPYDLARHIRG